MKSSTTLRTIPFIAIRAGARSQASSQNLLTRLALQLRQIMSFDSLLNMCAVQIPQTATGGHVVLPDCTAQLSRIRFGTSMAAQLSYVDVCSRCFLSA